VDDPHNALLEQLVQGQEEAFEAIFRQFEDKVYIWILRIVRDGNVAEDVLVETFWRAYRARASFDPSRSFGAWIRIIPTNASFDHLRTQRPRARWITIRDDIEAPTAVGSDLKESVALAFRPRNACSSPGTSDCVSDGRCAQCMALKSRNRMSIGLHGALLPLFLIPGGMVLAYLLDVFTIQLWYAIPIIPIGMGIYFLMWKFLVRFLNQEVGVA
jgi:RNA polymerase sigma factor (sigma-70 family)